MTVLDVHPVGYDTAARTLGADVAGGIGAVRDVLVAALVPCYGMAGTDETAQSWAPPYDDSARAAVNALTDVTNAAYRLAALLEQSAINYAGAEAACLPHETAWQSQTRWAHGELRRCAPPPSAAGLPVPEPEGWSLLAHLVGRLWPNGHQDLLHAAASAWTAAASTLDELGPVLTQAAAVLAAEQRAPEIADAVTVLRQYAGQVNGLSQHCRALGNACTALAHSIDEAHSRIGHECAEFVAITVSAEAAGGLLCVVTAGLSEAAAQAVVARAGVAAAAAIRSAIDALGAVVVTVASELDAIAARFAAVSAGVEPALARAVVQAEVVRPGVVGAVSSGARVETAFTRLDEFAKSLVPGGPAEETWADVATLEEHFEAHAKQFGATSPDAYARMAALFRLRAIREHLPMKLDRPAGTLRVYDPRTNTFASYRLDGLTRTMFKPKSGLKYWDRQSGDPFDG